MPNGSDILVWRDRADSCILVGPAGASDIHVGIGRTARREPAETFGNSRAARSCRRGLHLARQTAMELEPIVRRVREEFREMPGLRLTPAQARRLWGVEQEICRAVIDVLVAAAYLRWTAAGAIT